MARPIIFGNIPLGPATAEFGVFYPENVHPGAAVHMAVPPEHPLRARKGDLGETRIKDMDPRHSFESPGAPFANLRRR